MSFINDSVILEFRIQASVRKVWSAWTEPERILRWFGSDPEGWGLNAEIDLRPGGRYKISFSNSDGAIHTCMGEYIVVEKFEKLIFDWMWESEPGIKSHVTVNFFQEKAFTRMHFEHEHLGNASIHNYKEGWKTTFEKLKRELDTQ